MKRISYVFSFLGVLLILFVNLANFFEVSAAEGDALWAKSTVTAPNDSWFNDVATDTLGNSFAVGRIRGSGNTFGFGNSVTATSGCSGACPILVKYDSNGLAQWAKTITASVTQAEFFGVAVDSSGNVYAVGEVFSTGPYDFGNSVSVSGGIDSVNNLVLVKYNASGVAQWAKTISSSGFFLSSHLYGVSTDSSGNAYVIGTLDGDNSTVFDFGNSVTLTSASGTNGIIAKYNASGVAQWAKTISGGAGSIYKDIIADSSGNTYSAGRVDDSSTYAFGNSVTTTSGYNGQSSLIAKYNASGVAQWAKTISSGSSNSQFYAITIDASGNSYVSGSISGNSSFDFGNSVTATGTNTDTNPVIVKYDASGNASWASTTTSGSINSDYEGIAIDSMGHLYVSGIINTGVIGLGNGITATGVGNYNSMIVQYSASGVAQWAKASTTAPSLNQFYKIAVDSSDNPIAVGEIYGGTFSYGSVDVSGAYSDNPIIIKFEAAAAATPAPTATSAPQPTSGTTEAGAGSSENTNAQISFSRNSSGALTVNTVVDPIEDSSTLGQSVTAIVPPHIFNFNAFLSSQANPKNIKINIPGKRYVQIGNIQNIWYKAYPPDSNHTPALIGPSLQEKPSIISLSFAGFNLNGQNPKNLKLAYSPDGAKWKILPNSVVDISAKTVASVQKIGGYYSIISTTSSSNSKGTKDKVAQTNTPKPTPMINNVLFPSASPTTKVAPVNMPTAKHCILWWCW